MADEPKPEKKKKAKPSPKSLANLRRGNSRPGPPAGTHDGLSSGKGVPVYRASATQDLSRFCAELFVTKSVGKASETIGKTATWGWDAMKHPEFLETYEAIATKLTDKIIEKTAKKFVMSREYIDERMKVKMDAHLTHERLGDLDFAKMAEVAYKSIGAIQPAKVVASANAGAVAGVNAMQVYESQWLIQKRQEMSAQLEQKYPDGIPPTSPA